MPIYKYRAKRGPENILEGKIEAANEQEAVEKINTMGYLPVRVEEIKPAPSAQGPLLRIFPKKIKPSDITIFTRQLASLIKSGVPLLRGIGIVSEQSTNPYFKELLLHIHHQVRGGRSLSSALSDYPNVFNPLYLAMVRVGEDSGSLQEVLLRIADYRLKQQEIYSKVRVAFAYPVIMALMGIATVGFILTFVMPRLMQIFSNLGQTLPLPTQILIAVSSYLRRAWWVILLFSGILFSIIKRQAKAPFGKLLLSSLRLRLPLLGRFFLKAELARFSRALEILINTGIPILKALKLTYPILENEIIRQHLQRSYQQLERGGSFGESLKSSKLIPVFMSNLILVGEESGRLGDALKEVRDSYEREVEEAIGIMTSLLEPLLILGIGLVVGFIVIAMLLPIFQISTLY